MDECKALIGGLDGVDLGGVGEAPAADRRGAAAAGNKMKVSFATVLRKL